MLFAGYKDLPRWLVYWLAFGVFWFLVASVWSPDSKLYHQGMVVFYWLPVLVSFFIRPGNYWPVINNNRFLVVAFFGSSSLGVESGPSLGSP